MPRTVVILTGDELRHRYFRKSMANDDRFHVAASLCESDAKSLKSRVDTDAGASWLQRQHVLAREQSERDFFEEFVDGAVDRSNPIHVDKGRVNDEQVVRQIEDLRPDLLVCYGSSLVKSRLVADYAGRFLNVHLGLSPYYRGSGTNVFPIINGELGLVGVTFMHIDEGIDTGEIIHQIRADVFVGDSPHTIGNRLIRKMTQVYAELIDAFDRLERPSQPNAEGKLYLQKDFTNDACAALYAQFEGGAVERYLSGEDRSGRLPIVQNGALQ
jgi:folate-dependent phosphoribosylglycinamide formyltransferase PurN